jgi:alkanesulfonate monooxygenase SsuD/methylene tetrahydromethanopterin reductase-like flavin-dependent oxidoreductase (luciferase family)
MLTDHKNDIFATHDTMPSALRYVNELCAAAASSADSIAIRTAAHIILNTAIELHRAEKKVLIDKINEMSARANPVTALMSLVREQVREAIAEQDVGELIENWMADNLDDKIEEWHKENIDIDNAVEDYMDKQSIMGDLISEKIGNFFGNNTFTIEPR